MNHLPSFLRRPAGPALALWLVLAAQAGAQSQWVAYNDHYRGPNTAPNVSSWNVFTNLAGAPGISGPLTNVATGVQLSLTLTVTSVVSGIQGGTVAGGPNSGTPAALAFTNYIDFGIATVNNAIQMAGSSRVAHIFSGCDTSRRYSWRGTAARANNYTDRWTLVEIAAAASTPAHASTPVTLSTYFKTADIGALTASQVVCNFGENRAAGMLAGWDDIQPNPDGTIVIYSSTWRGTMPAGYSSAGTYGYAVAADRLEEFVIGPPMPPAIGLQPQATTVNERQVASLSVVATGSGLSYQWYYAPTVVGAGTSIPGAISATYAVTNRLGGSRYPWSNPMDSGAYYVIVSGTAGAPVESTHVVLTVNPDVTAPTLRYATCGPGANEVTATFSEAMNNETGDVTDQFLWEFRTLDDFEAIQLAGNGVYTDDGFSTTIVFTFDAPGRDPAKSYKLVRASDPGSAVAYDTARTPNGLARGASIPILCFTNEIFGLSKSWQYNDKDVDPGATWPNVVFNDASSPWATGTGPFDAKRDGGVVGPTGFDDCRAMTLYGLGAVGTCLRLTTPATSTPPLTNLATAYFRTHFSFAGNPANTYLQVSGKVDDGAILYLNGTEVGRLRVGAGPIAHGAYTANTGVGDTDPQDVVPLINPPALVVGDNVLAVLLKQVNVTSSDLTMGLALAEISATPAVTRSVLTITYSGGQPTISWTPSGGTLQYKNNLTDTWTDIGAATTPYTDPVNTTTVTHRFYQVRVP